MDKKTSLIITLALGVLAGAAVGYFLAGGKIDDFSEEAERLKKEVENNLEKGKKVVQKIKETIPGIFSSESSTD